MNSETAVRDVVTALTAALDEGRHDDVRDLIVRLVDLSETLPAGSRHVTDLLDTIAAAYVAVGAPEEALPYLRRSLAVLRSDRSCEAAVLRARIRDVARIEAQTENLSEAEGLYRELIERTRMEAGDDALELATDLTELAGIITLRAGATLEARALLVRALEMHRRAQGSDPVAMATTLGRLGLNHQRRGETRAALPMFEESLRLRRQALPETAAEIADALNNVGIAYLELGDLPAARDAFQQAEAVLLDAEVVDRYRLVFVDTNLADLDRQTGRYADAERHARRATESAIALFGEEHPQTAAAQNILALIYQTTGRLEEASSLMEGVVRIRRARRMSAPVEEILALNNLATVRASLGMYDEALAILREARTLAVGTVGEHHALTASTLDNEAQIHRLMGRSTTGIEHARRAVEIRRSAQGERHADYAASLSSLAKLLMDANEFVEAEAVQMRAVAIEREILGTDHFRYGIDLGTIATIYRQTGRLHEAEAVQHLALKTVIRAFGPDHSEVATQLGNLASIADKLGDLDTAIDLARDAREIGRRALGEWHPEAIVSLYNLAALLVKRGFFLEAQPLAGQALEIARRHLRSDQREFSYALGKLSEIQEELGNYALAEALLREKLGLLRRICG